MYNTGSSKKLTGSCLALTIFISEKDDPWKNSKKDAIYEMVFEAQQWLMHEAERYGVSLSFENLQFGQEKDIQFDSIPDDDFEEWVQKICRKLGYQSSQEFHEDLKREGYFDNIFLLVIVKKKGISYALPFSRGVVRDYYLEAAVLYRKDEDGKLIPATIAHEILHLFGAWDLYQAGRKDQKRAGKAEKEFPGEIMLQLEDNINDNNIGGLTAWRVGWISQQEDWYKDLKPPD